MLEFHKSTVHRSESSQSGIVVVVVVVVVVDEVVVVLVVEVVVVVGVWMQPMDELQESMVDGSASSQFTLGW